MTPEARITYRPDIEGLRAVAILLVVAAHAQVPGFDAGFIGVDVFFVISGFLITGLLVAEHQQTGRIKFARFYARRFRRLLPALLLMLAVTAVAAWILLPAASQPYQAWAGVAASTWLSNLYFAFERIDYFGAVAESNIYLHTWSLGVEEQFYLVWPVLILLLLRTGKGTGSHHRISTGMFALLLVSLLACVWLTLISTRYAFYLMPARAWQFAAGAMACLHAPRLSELVRARQARWLGDAIGIAGVGLLVAAMLFIDSRTAYPGIWAALPTLATVLLLLAACDGRSLTTRVLSIAPMQMIGKLSYAWYLWHWPVLVLGALLIPDQALEGRLMLVLASLGIAILSYLMVERPLRRNSELVRAPSQFILASLLLMAAAVLLFVRGGQQEATRLVAQDDWQPFRVEVPRIYSMGCDDWYHSDRLVPCVFGPDSAPRTAVVMGDSIGLQWFPAFERIFSGPEWRLVVLTKSACAMVDRPIHYSRIGREYVECASWRNAALDHAANLSPEIMILGSSHTYDFSRSDWVDGTGAVLGRIAPSASKVFIIRSTPLLPFNAATCVGSQLQLHGTVTEEACRAPDKDERNRQVASWLSESIERWRNVELLDMNDLVCADGFCRATQGEGLIYRDGQHLNAGFVGALSSQMAKRMGLAGLLGVEANGPVDVPSDLPTSPPLP